MPKNKKSNQDHIIEVASEEKKPIKNEYFYDLYALVESMNL